MLGTLLAAGVPLINGLNVARKSIETRFSWMRSPTPLNASRKAPRWDRAFATCRELFTGSVLEMISVAEESGRLDQELIRLADVTERDLDRELKMAVALAEPLMLFFIAGFIGTIFIGMVLPIFSFRITSNKPQRSCHDETQTNQLGINLGSTEAFTPDRTAPGARNPRVLAAIVVPSSRTARSRHA